MLKPQLAPAASDVPHVLPDIGNAAPPPLATETLVAVAPPVLVIVTGCAALAAPTLPLPKDSADGPPCTLGADADTPVPESAIGTLVPPLPVTVYVELKAPAIVGLKVKVMVHEAPAAIDAPHVFETEKLAGVAGYTMLL